MNKYLISKFTKWNVLDIKEVIETIHSNVNPLHQIRNVIINSANLFYKRLALVQNDLKITFFKKRELYSWSNLSKF